MFSFLQTNEMRSQQIAQLTEILVDACLNQTDEQNSLAKELDQLLSKNAMTNQQTFDFLSSPKSKPRKTQKKIPCKSDSRLRHNSVGTLQPPTPVSKAKVIKKAKKPTVPSSPKRRLSTTEEPQYYAETFSAPASPMTSNLGLNMGGLLTENLVNIPSTSSTTPKKLLEMVEEKKADKVSQLLKAIELSSDDFTVMVLCRILEGYVTVGSKPLRQRRLRQMVRLDAASHLFRSIKSNCHIPEPTPFKVIANDQLITTAIRLSGLLNDLCSRILEIERIFCTIALLRFTCRAMKSRKLGWRGF
ncbi:unnamed protein product [Bursaphelenchus xylophilus]|uniref:(pine wood nematode) hypothetical protein n=1 Tax=Bursaphelenchus xylophilus TaxID=6326 RepID=A0A7I8XNC9_BURXY|nr:unnamed protein product [Bursaphelenchus xylophilus]CAG9080759.1 unnamed protein product [Bursaphelenchus xylophilus]